MAFCNKCGTKLSEDSKFCSKCGNEKKGHSGLKHHISKSKEKIKAAVSNIKLTHKKSSDSDKKRKVIKSSISNKTKKGTYWFKCADCNKRIGVKLTADDDLDSGVSIECHLCQSQNEFTTDDVITVGTKTRTSISEPELDEGKGVVGAIFSIIGGLIKFAAILILLGIVLLIGFIAVTSLLESGELSGSGIPLVDPCERAFDQCNRECGEGWFNGLCKSSCTKNYNGCRGN